MVEWNDFKEPTQNRRGENGSLKEHVRGSGREISGPIIAVKWVINGQMRGINEE